jgi:UDPglucose--hexose-1-phosphate uridylyltransferase
VRPDGGAADTPGWTTRVVPNLYPALGDGEDGPRPDSKPDLFASRPAIGAHEVLINAPEHVTAMAELSEERFLGAVATWRERMRAHAESPYVQLVVNEGAGAGASLPHTHAQLYALPFVPAAVARERERAGAYGERTAGGSLLSDILVEEVRRRERLVAIDDEAALICPWASHSPYELRVIPRREAARFEEDSSGAAMIRTAMQLLTKRFDGPPELNLWVSTAPRGTEAFHWHVDIAPRLTIKAGLELGAGVDIDIYPPERAAADLRECL